LRPAVPVFEIVIVCAEDELLTDTLLKVMVVGDKDIAGANAAVPVPLNDTVAVGVDASLDGMLNDAVFAPVDVGEKITCTVQFPDEASVCPVQLSFCIANWSEFVPVRVSVPMVREAVPLLVTVTVWAEDEALLVTVPKDREEVDNEIVATAPVPVKETVAVPEGAFDGMLRLADFAPVDVGEKTACTVHVPDGATVWLEQLSFCMLN